MPSTRIKITIVLTGYYYKYLELYDIITCETKLYPYIEFELFISSHIEETEISKPVLSFLKNNNWKIIYFSNEGWDWGCHSEFINYYFKTGKKLPEHFLFLHDDIKITKNGFIDAFLKKRQQGFAVVGNSLPFSVIKDYSAEFPEEEYLLNRHGFSTSIKEIKPVRGSAFFIDSKLVENSLKHLPYQRVGAIDLANRSLRMFASIIANDFPECRTGYLSSDHLKSDFLIEEMRGTRQNRMFFIKRKFLDLRKSVKYLMEDLLIDFKILKRQKQQTKKGKIKVNISNNTPRTGYLNYDINNLKYSDILDLDLELGNLIRSNRISEIRIKENTGDFKNLFIKKLAGPDNSLKGKFDVILEGASSLEVPNNPKIKTYKDYYLAYGQFIPGQRTLLKVDS